MAVKPGDFVWYELMANDLKAAEEFYRMVLGWDTKDAGMAGCPYTLVSAGKAMVGGLMVLPEDVRARGVGPCWSGYIMVDDVDAYVQRVKEAGGAVRREPEDIPGVGRFSVVADPYGAVFILFKGAEEEMAPEYGDLRTPGKVGWHELWTDNLEEAFGFYSRLFGWVKAEAVDMGEMGIYQTVKTAGSPEPVVGMMARQGKMPPPFWLYYFNTDSIDKAQARVVQAGGKILHGPQEIPDGRYVVQCADPQGAPFALLGGR